MGEDGAGRTMKTGNGWLGNELEVDEIFGSEL
jgi:hypothetical protein